MSGRDKGKMERIVGPFLLRGTEETHRPHNPTTVVMLYLADCVTARWHPPTHTHSQHTALSKPTPLAHTEGSPLRVKEKNKAIHCCFTSGTAKPQLYHSWLLTLSCFAGLRHTPLCQCLVQKCGGWKDRKWV